MMDDLLLQFDLVNDGEDVGMTAAAAALLAGVELASTRSYPDP